MVRIGSLRNNVVKRQGRRVLTKAFFFKEKRNYDFFLSLEYSARRPCCKHDVSTSSGRRKHLPYELPTNC